MPIYEYKCEDCGKDFDTLRPMSQADTAIACEKCGGAHTRRKLSLFFAQSLPIKQLLHSPPQSTSVSSKSFILL